MDCKKTFYMLLNIKFKGRSHLGLAKAGLECGVVIMLNGLHREITVPVIKKPVIKNSSLVRLTSTCQGQLHNGVA